MLSVDGHTSKRKPEALKRLDGLKKVRAELGEYGIRGRFGRK